MSRGYIYVARGLHSRRTEDPELRARQDAIIYRTRRCPWAPGLYAFDVYHRAFDLQMEAIGRWEAREHDSQTTRPSQEPDA